MKSVLLAIIILLFSLNAHADIYATTDDGARVLLNEDGTWSFYKEPPLVKEHIYMDSLVRIEVKDVKITGFLGIDDMPITEITFAVTSASKTKIISPKTHMIYGYEDGSDVGGTMPWGFSLSDNYGNDLKVGSLSPEFISRKQQGLRPGATIIFTLIANDYPLETISYLQLSIDKNIFENDKKIKLVIPKHMVRNTLHEKSKQ